LQNDLRLLVDTLPGLVWTTLPDGQVDFLNQPWCEYAGMTLEEGRGTGWLKAVCPDDLPRMAAYWQSILKSGSSGEIEARLRGSDGLFRWFLFRANPLRDESGEIIKWIGTNTDIEDRVRAENSVRASERHFREIVDSIPALIAVMNSAGEVEVVNRQCLEYFDKSLDELKAWMAEGGTVHADDLPAVASAWTHSVETGTPYDIEHRIRRNDGSYRWFHVRGLPMRDSAGRIVRWHVLQVDIEEQKRAETMLAAKNHLLEMVASGDTLRDTLIELCRIVEDATSMHCSVVLVDPTGTHLEQGVAPTLPESFVSEINGRPVNADSGPCAMAAFLNRQVISSDIAADSRWGDWNWCPLALSHGLRACWSTPIRSKNGEALGAFALYYEEPRTPTAFEHDLIDQFTHLASIAIDRAQSDNALERARAELARFARLAAASALTGSIAHEVNQPLSGIITNAGTSLRMLAETPPNVGDAIEAVRRTVRDANRAAQVVARVRALYRKTEAVSDWVDLNDAIREVVALTASEIQRARVIVKLNLPGDLPLVRGDRVQLQQVMLNLLLNAIEAMAGVTDEVRQLTLTTECDGNDRIQVSVSDTGSGLDSNNLNQPFEAFYTTKSGGMGIGLSVSRSIIQSHDGRLWATANSGRGATFAFSIPREFDGAAVPA
jgi:PAS domain S-box-containing protein